MQPYSAANDSLKAIDRITSVGLLGASDSLGYRVTEIERHMHSWERWMGLSNAPSGETHRASTMNTYTALAPVAPFPLAAGDDSWGSWVQILGSSDTPVIGTHKSYDIHKVAFNANSKAGAYVIQIGFGTSAAQALSDGTFSGVVAEFDAINFQNDTTFQMERVAAGTKAWARCLCPGNTTGTLKFYFGIHEYEG